MTIREALFLLKKELSVPLGCFAQPQSEEILQFIFNCSRSELFLWSGQLLTDSQIQLLNAVLKRRLNGEPLSYILGKTFFYSREFKVTRDTLIPRPDTEILVEQVLLNEKNENTCFADVGIGSGIIASILNEERPHWKAFGIDISFQTLLVAKQNLTTPVHLVCSDLLSAIKASATFDFIVSNPPYISADELNTLDPEVKDFEPHLALYGGEDGLDYYRRLTNEAKKILKKSGRLYCEIGYNQQNSVTEIFSSTGWKELNITKDLSGHPRVLRVVLEDSES
ncbi:MAG TPA: peptide chain release factor N(5)-glutamine methyltransferase [Chitinispirillaceae bacterium]|nr:peptide chain release factor N(5)-glutamine methyltransferase [Chitinispirillaceae bacterium]